MEYLLSCTNCTRWSFNVSLFLSAIKQKLAFEMEEWGGMEEESIGAKEVRDIGEFSKGQ